MPSAQCPVDTAIVKVRVENSTRDSEVRVQLIFANEQPGPAAESAPQEGAFVSYRILSRRTRSSLT